MNYFKDPIAVRNQKPKEVKKSPWDFSSPKYDNRSGPFVKAGTDYGVGHRNPVGHKNGAKANVDTMPMTSGSINEEI